MTRQRLRPSQVITTFGPGAILDLPDDSVMLAGIEHWFPGGLAGRNSRTIFEPRLQAVLHVQSFRTPPVGSPGDRDLPFVRFPIWRVCPACSRLSDAYVLLTQTTGPQAVPRCGGCRRATHPARLIVACARGHIDDFPWIVWAHGPGRSCGAPILALRGGGRSAALGDLEVVCACGRSRSLAGALGAGSVAQLLRGCSGRRPWLDAGQESCQATPEALQRGASNVYFSVTRSALSIPPWTDPLQQQVAAFLTQFPGPLQPEDVDQVLRLRFPSEDPSRVRECLNRIEQLQVPGLNLRAAEYHVLNAAADISESAFETVRQRIGQRAGNLIETVIAIPRLREVRALTGFTRLEAPELDPTMEALDEAPRPLPDPAPLAARAQGWLPAIENLGEGIFIRLRADRIGRWEAQPQVMARGASLLDAYSAWRQSRGLTSLGARPPRLILLHTFAHLLMRELALDSGYSSTSIRERIYAGEGMAGILLYTATPDSDGSLGGLVRQAREAPFEGLVLSALEAAEVCSSDPLCREHDARRTGRLNGAACHACAMASETSCEFGNRLLDRALVLPLPGIEGVGFAEHARP